MPRVGSAFHTSPARQVSGNCSTPRLHMRVSCCAACTRIEAGTPDGPEVTLSFPADSVPTRRVVGKQSLHERKLRLGPAAADVQALSSAAAALLTHRPIPFRTASGLLLSAPALWDCARPWPPRLSANDSAQYLLFGWYRHGGLTGVTRLTYQMPGVVQLLNNLLAQAAPAATWTTLALFSSPAAGPHVDRRNLKGSCNHVLPLALPPGEQYIWVQHPVAASLQSLAWLGDHGQFPAASCCWSLCTDACLAGTFARVQSRALCCAGWLLRALE